MTLADADALPEDRLRSGIAAYRQGNIAEAARQFSAVLAADPGHSAARINLANALWSQRDYAGAAQQAEIARGANPDSVEAWIITGAIRLDSGDAYGAIAAYTQATRLRPGQAAAQAGLAAALLAEGRNQEAEQAASRALDLAPGNIHALFTLASARLARHQAQPALELFDAILDAMPGHARARHNRGNALIDLGRLEEAEAELETCLAIAPDLKEAWATLGYLLTIQADLPAAIAACNQAIALDPDFAAGQWNRCVALLLSGDFPGGFAAYEWRKRHPVFRHHFTPIPGASWTGEDLAGKHLLIRAEQGYGDTIMLARFLPQLAAKAAKLTLCCPPTLFPLFRHLPIALRALNDPPRAPDFSADQLSLPHILRISEADIPFAGGYLQADPARLQALESKLPQGRPRIGLVWSGNPGHDNDHHRSLPVGALSPLLEIPGFTFLNLQLGARRHEYPIHDTAALIHDYGDTAAIVSGLDAVVTVDTSVAHVAGALAIPCHVLVSRACDWRWRLGRDSTAWYDSLTLHRQDRLDDWSHPIASAISSLRHSLLPARAT
jgi:tetratricopeptide (TPR) repeat protein